MIIRQQWFVINYYQDIFAARTRISEIVDGVGLLLWPSSWHLFAVTFILVYTASSSVLISNKSLLMDNQIMENTSAIIFIFHMDVKKDLLTASYCAYKIDRGSDTLFVNSLNLMCIFPGHWLSHNMLIQCLRCKDLRL